MKKIAVLLLALVLVFANLNAQEHIVKFKISSKKELKTLPRYVSVDNVKNNEVTAYIWGENFKKFQSLDIPYTEIHKKVPKVINMATTVDQMANWDRYPTYDVYVQMMQNFANDYPEICKLDTIGTSQQGRLLLVVRITDNVNQDEQEPEFFYTSTMHGDETTGFVLMLRLIDYLLSNYSSDSEVADLVNNYDIWINPLANPDGTYAGGNNDVSGSQRELANGDDPNRDFPYPLDVNHTTSNPETNAMMDFGTSHYFVMSANFHGGAEVYNYPWDCWETTENAPADADWFIHIGTSYVQTARQNNSNYMTDVNSSGVTEGADWYYAYGTRQDFMNYFAHCKEVTVELSSLKLLSSDDLPTYWTYNKQSLLNYIKEARYGFNGTVTNPDAEPLDAKVEILNYDKDNSWVTTDPKTGDYYRPVEPGTYQVQYSAEGYISQVIEVTVSDWETTTIQNVVLQPANQTVVTGTVIDASTGDPVENAKISFLNTSIADVYTDANGQYSQTVYENSYQIMAYKDGFATQVQTVTVTQENNIVDFALQPSNAITFEDSIPSDFVFSGDANWYRDNTTAYEGDYSLRSGSITDDEQSIVEVTRNVIDGVVKFWYKVSSEEDYDYLTFYIDGQLQDSWSGEIDWTQASYTVSAGTHTFKWEYDKDQSVSDGSDCAWIDNIEFPEESSLTSHSVTFTVTSSADGSPIQDATINLQGYGEQQTNSSGVATFTQVYETSDTNTLAYTVSASGYLDANGRIAVTSDVSENISLQPAPAEIQSNSSALTVYPNPVENVINVNSSQNIVLMQVVDLSGDILLQSKGKSIDVESLPDGLYLLKIITENEIITNKFVKK